MRARPFIKWIGGKSAIAKHIVDKFGHFDDRSIYYEPFLGGGAVFLELRNRGFKGKAYLMDANKELINVWGVLRDEPQLLINALKHHVQEHSEKHYYNVRDLIRNYENWQHFKPEQKAAAFLYLNKTCFNGLFRVNKKGQFNASFGKTSTGKPPKILDEALLREAHEALRQGLSYVSDSAFPSFCGNRPIGEGKDIIYCDPPYDGDYSNYTAEGFGQQDQIRVAEKAKQWRDEGAKVIVSNSDTPFIRELYAGSEIEEVEVARKVNCDKTGRGPVKELIISL